jgi:Xaa-Pro aminopeptidase
MSHAPEDVLRRRHEAIRIDLAARGLEALIVTSLPNVLYLTNFTGTAGIVVVTADHIRFLTDSRYATAVADGQSNGDCKCPCLELVLVGGSYDATLTGVIASLPGTRVGFEAAHLTVSRLTWLMAALERAAAAKELVATEGLVEQVRAVKDAYELDTLREAAQRLSQVADTVLQNDVRRGRTEREVAFSVDCRIRDAGFARTAFETIVAAGPNSALPHARPGERRLTEGDLVVLDFGGVYDSYCVDLTRTVSVGPAGGRSREVYGAVREAHDRAIAAVAPGQSRFEVDRAARDTLAERGLGAAFGHGTGHGLGIEVHEDPRISRRRPEIDDSVTDEFLAAGMVFTIEPGVYLPGWGGVRIEDDVLVTRNGVDLLTQVTTELVEI